MPRKILILAANPKSTPRLRLDEEVREIDNGLQRAKQRDEFVIRQQWAIRAQDVRRAMLDFTPNIVHFCGHGHGEAGIAMEDETGQARLVSADALAGFFALFADSVQCVVLNACYSEVQAKAIGQHIDYVVGMSQGIADAASLEFAVAFYDALGAGRTFEFAFKLARNAIKMAGIPEFLTPVMVVRGVIQGEFSQPRTSQPGSQSQTARGDTRIGTTPYEPPPLTTRGEALRQSTLSRIQSKSQASKPRRTERKKARAYRIDSEMCIACGACEPECPEECISGDDESFVIDPTCCTGCGECVEVCPVEAIERA